MSRFSQFTDEELEHMYNAIMSYDGSWEDDPYSETDGWNGEHMVEMSDVLIREIKAELDRRKGEEE